MGGVDVTDLHADGVEALALKAGEPDLHRAGVVEARLGGEVDVQLLCEGWQALDGLAAETGARVTTSPGSVSPIKFPIHSRGWPGKSRDAMGWRNARTPTETRST